MISGWRSIDILGSIWKDSSSTKKEKQSMKRVLSPRLIFAILKCRWVKKTSFKHSSRKQWVTYERNIVKSASNFSSTTLIAKNN